MPFQKNRSSRANGLKRSHLVPVTSLVALLAGCAVTPQPIAESEVRDRVQADQFKIYGAQEPVFHPVTFKEVLARSLKYNLDYRLKLMESALSQGLAEVSNYEMLPNLLVSAGYTSRNNLTGSQSFQILPDGSTTDLQTYSGGQERQRHTLGAEFSWNILDFGVGYYRAKQQADQVLIAEERRRRVVQNILQDVRSAYWRAVGAQRLAKDAERLMVRVRGALERSREAEAQGLISPKEALGYQRLLLDAVTLLSSRRQELDFAKRELAALMNITPGTDFTVAEEAEPDLPPVPANVAELEEMALTFRPELRQEDYQRRITASEARKQMLYLLPNLGVNIAAQYDSNKYLYNKHWIEASTRVTFNLLRALAIPATERAQEAQVNADDMRRMALSMAVLTQVRVAIERYSMALKDLEIAKESNQVDQRLAAYARAALTTRADSELEVIRAETRALNSEFQRYSAFASAQTAFGRIYNSVGLEVLPEGADQADLGQLGELVADNVKTIEREAFVGSILKAQPTPAIRLQLQVAPMTTEFGAKPATQGGAQTVRVAQDISLNAMARSRYPDDRAARDEFRRLMILANPNFLKPGEEAGRQILKGGAQIVVPPNLPPREGAPVADAAPEKERLPAVIEASEAEMRKVVSRALQRNHIPLAGDADNSPTLMLKLAVEPARNGIRRAHWLVSLRDASGKELGNSRYSSSLAAEPSANSLMAFAEAAMISALRPMNQWLADARQQ